MQEVSSTLPKTFSLLRNIFDAWAPSPGDSQQVRTPLDAPGSFLSWETWENTFTPSPTVEVGPKMHHSALRHLINTVPCFTRVFPFIQTHMCVCRSLPWFLFCCSNWGRKKIQAWLMLCWTACQASGLTRYPAPLFSTFLLYRTVNTNHCMSPLCCVDLHHFKSSSLEIVLIKAEFIFWI